jgi:hypothetical protein
MQARLAGSGPPPVSEARNDKRPPPAQPLVTITKLSRNLPLLCLRLGIVNCALCLSGRICV